VMGLVTLSRSASLAEVSRAPAPERG
jgi:hypothetical protein